MNASRDADRFIRDFLETGVNELPERSFDAVRTSIEATRQRFAFGPWREEFVMRYATFAIAAIAVVVIAAIGIRFLPGNGGFGSQPTPIPDPNGVLVPGPRYEVHPFAPANNIGFTFAVPSTNWEAITFDGGTDGIAWAGDSGGVGLGFLRVKSLNPDPCSWDGTADDLVIGPSVDDLVNALQASQARYSVSEPMPVSVSGYSGKSMQLTLLGDGFSTSNGSATSGCDQGIYRIWNADGFDIHAQGLANNWVLRIVDVNGQRVVILASSLAGSEPLRLAELQRISDVVAIDP